MQKWIVINALPPAVLAQSLSQALQSSDPGLSERMDQLTQCYRVHIEPSSLLDYGCTPGERMRLESLGLTSALSPSGVTLPPGSALAALDAGQTDRQQAVWMAQACSTMVSAHGTSLVTLPHLQASDQDLLALNDAVTALETQAEHGIELRQHEPGIWLVHGQFEPDSWLTSPASVQGQDASQAWPTQPQWRNWRRLVSEIQMMWHDHPVNEQRQIDGLPAINTLWLYGGATGWTPTPSDNIRWFDEMQTAASHGQWSGWIQAWQPFIDSWWTHVHTNKAPLPTIVLTGADRLVYLQPKRRNLHRAGPLAMLSSLAHRWQRKPQTPNWRNWWNNT